jgi:FlaA1/EpsC-like NDP-sugar epimerase
MKRGSIVNNRTLIVLHDLGMAVIAWFSAWWIRYNLAFPFPEWQVCLYTLPFVLFIQTAIFWRFSLYRGIWRFASLPDLWNIFRAAILGAMIITLCLFILFRLEGVPRSVLVLYPMLLIILLGGPRLGYRLWKDRSLNLIAGSRGRSIFIIGAGRAGEMLAREMLRDGSYTPIGFIDDNPALARSEIHGIRVLGPVSDLEFYTSKYSPEFIVIAVPSASNEQMQRIVELVKNTNLPVRTLPKLNEMISGNPSLKELREVSIEDLLGRDRIELDWMLLQQGISSKTVMVTGGGGSIGSELCRQICGLNPEHLIILDQSEFNLYRILQELGTYKDKFRLTGVLADICDKDKIDQVFRQHKPQLIFHAAAYKHVPILENECREAVRNNIFGTLCTANAAEKYHADKFILISTDKAVNPVNVLGSTKRLAEMFCESRNRKGKTRFITVRFGNVLGSDGSVVPLFQQQIRNGGPVTVTHPEISRYFMTIRESCQLILQTAVMGQGGEIYVLDMGTPVKILYLAEQMIKLTNPWPDKNIEIRITGLRPGEKLHEELFYADEQKIRTSHEKILIARHPEINAKQLLAIISELDSACSEFDDVRIKRLLHSAVLYDDKTIGHIKNNIIPIIQA